MHNFEIQNNNIGKIEEFLRAETDKEKELFLRNNSTKIFKKLNNINFF